MISKKREILGSLCLLLAAFVWGVAFVAQTEGMEHVGPFTFQGLRFVIAVIVLLPVMLITNSFKKKQGTYTPLTKKQKIYHIKAGIVCGLVLTVASNVQQFGLQYTTAGKGGFITAMYILFVPLLGIFARKKVPFKIWICVALATIGLYFLCINESFSLNKGDIIVLICAICFSFHILVVDKYSPQCDGIRLSILQFSVAGIVSVILMLIIEKPQLNNIISAWLPIAYAGVLSCAGGYTLQIIGQKYSSNPTIASLLMSLESVFSVLAQMLILKDILSVKETLGCILMFSAIVLAQINIKKTKLGLRLPTP